MRNIKLEIEYDGTGYCGWQVQNRPKTKDQRPKTAKKSIQEAIEKTLQKILQEKIKLIASGRTDAGVHALAQVANFKTETKIPAWKLQRALNGNLTKDIAITKVEDVLPDFHSRFQAKSKTYRYTILNRNYPSALLKDKVYHFPYPLDVDLMRREARALLGKHDFKSFGASASSVKGTVRTIKKIAIKKSTYDSREPSLITIDIEADGFLYNMVRNIVGTLIEIGRGKLGKGSVKRVLALRGREFAGPLVPARGLCLLKVKY